MCCNEERQNGHAAMTKKSLDRQHQINELIAIGSAESQYPLRLSPVSASADDIHH